MKLETRLLRQINPGFMQGTRVTSQAFRPTPKDEHLLSVDDGDQIEPEESYKRFVLRPDCRSRGVMAVTYGECQALSLEVIPDGAPYPEHVSINFSGYSNSQVEKHGKKLAHHARLRGWFYQP